MKFIKVVRSRKLENIKKDIDKTNEKLNRLQLKFDKALSKIKEYNFDPNVFDAWRNTSNPDDAFDQLMKYNIAQEDIEYAQKQLKRLNEEYEQAKIKETDQPKIAPISNEEIPQVLKEYQETLENELFEEDMRLKRMYQEDYSTLGYEKYRQKYTGMISFADDLRYASEEKIRNTSKKRANQFITNLYRKIKEKVGNIKYCALYFNGRDINGRIYGENCDLHLTTILAGGYNIQRLHNRYLIKEVKTETK